MHEKRKDTNSYPVLCITVDGTDDNVYYGHDHRIRM